MSVLPTGVDHVSINVTDVPAALAFYTETLGLTQNSSRPDFGFPGAWLDTANGIHIPLSQNMNNPGPAGYPQLKQPYERILQFKGGTTFVVIPTGPAKDGWVNAFS